MQGLPGADLLKLQTQDCRLELPEADVLTPRLLEKLAAFIPQPADAAPPARFYRTHIKTCMIITLAFQDFAANHEM